MPMNLCNQCPRKCNALRNENENIGGFCGMPSLPVIARADLHFGEEPCISGKNGSGTIFFSGCNLKCVFCQNYDISHNNFGEKVSVKRLAEIMYELEQKGANNINFVNPSHYVDAISQALKIYSPKIPLVYNSSSYDSLLVLDQNLFDIYLLDLKYLSHDRALKYSKVSNYNSVATTFIKKAYEIANNCIIDSSGIMKKGLIIRHLVMPLGTNEAIKVIDWFKNNTPNAYLSLMSQFVPCGKCDEYSEINRKITLREYNKVLNYLFDTNIENAYVQELSSSSKNFVPDFNGFGVKKP